MSLLTRIVRTGWSTTVVLASTALVGLGCAGETRVERTPSRAEQAPPSAENVPRVDENPDSEPTPTRGKPAPRFVSGTPVPHLIMPEETHFKALYQLTEGGKNVHASFSWDDRHLIFQVIEGADACDQIVTLPKRGGYERPVSDGDGQATSPSYFPGDERVVYSSTHHHDANCPSAPDYSHGFVWSIEETADLFVSNPDGSNREQLTQTEGYDAEASVGPDGTVAFTSMRDGDLEIYTMDADGSNVRRLTEAAGYDGAPRFSPDGALLCFQANYPANGPELERSHKLLREGLVEPAGLEVYVMKRDGTEKTALTNNGGANLAPSFHPSGQHIIFSSNANDPAGLDFDLFLIDLEEMSSRQITFHDGVDGSPTFSRDGQFLVFSSSRGAKTRGETNLFLAQWVETEE